MIIAALRFQPTKRPQIAQKPKPKPSYPKSAETTTPRNVPAAPTTTSQRPPSKTTLADWTGIGDDDDVNGFYGGGEKRQRGGKRRKKNNKREEYVAVQDWDDIYDPSRPNSYEEYKHSDEKIREVREWKDRLYAHRTARKVESEKDSDEEEYRPQMGSESSLCGYAYMVLIYTEQFAPPNYSFAPPPIDSPKKPVVNTDTKVEANSPAPIHNIPPPPPPPQDTPPAPPAPATAGAISRAPVRYNLPAPPSDIPSSEAELAAALAEEPASDDEAPRSLRPGQKGFAERLMSKYGWSKGKGLGAEESGIVNPLRVQIEKRKKKSDAEGGGFREPAGRAKIIGGKRNMPDKKEEGGKFGVMSEVVVLRGMVDGMDLDQEVEGAGDGGLMQEIGEECGEKVCVFEFGGWIRLTCASMGEWSGCILIDMERSRRFLSSLRVSSLR